MDLPTAKLIQTGIVLLIYIVVRYAARYFTHRTLKKFKFNLRRRKSTAKGINIVLQVICVLALLGIWGFDGAQAFVFITSILAFIGVALFAQWSLLSNVTAGFILYFSHPLKIGDYLKVVDKDTPIEGTVEDITMFFLYLKTKEGHLFTIPNNLVLQKILTGGETEQNDWVR